MTWPEAAVEIVEMLAWVTIVGIILCAWGTRD